MSGTTAIFASGCAQSANPANQRSNEGDQVSLNLGGNVQDQMRSLLFTDASQPQQSGAWTKVRFELLKQNSVRDHSNQAAETGKVLRLRFGNTIKADVLRNITEKLR